MPWWTCYCGIAAFLSLFVSRKLTLPIEHIKRWEIGRCGGWQVRPPVLDPRRFRALAEAMNQMALELRDRIDTVMRQRNEMEAVLASMVEGVIAVDTDERLISITSSRRDVRVRSLSGQGRSMQEVVRNTVFHQFLRSLIQSGPIEKDIVLPSEVNGF